MTRTLLTALVVSACCVTSAHAAPQVVFETAEGCRMIADGADITFQGCNVHIENGRGGSYSDNGRGNLIIGYNESAGGESRDGSHNVVVGPYHTYSSHGGLVSGQSNAITSPSAIALGGEDNVASGLGAVSVGGVMNSATGPRSVSIGGAENFASGESAVTLGGKENAAARELTAVVGGSQNEAVAPGAVIAGGAMNTGAQAYSATVGGYRTGDKASR